MKISRFAASGVASLPDLDCDFLSPATGRPHDLIVVSGPAASGKTRLCDLILATLEAAGGYLGIVSPHDWYADPSRGARAEVDLWLDEGPSPDGSAPPAPARGRAVVRFGAHGVGVEIERSVARRLSRYDHDPAHGKREYFHEGRQRAWGAREDGMGPHEQALLRCTKDPQKYSFVPGFLATLRIDEGRRRAFAQNLELLSPGVRFSPAERIDEPTACFVTKDGRRPAYADLSSAEADAVIIAATAALIALNHSIVVLDRPELYVAPDRLVDWVQALTQLGEGNQWIVATSDDGLVSSVDRSQHIALGKGESLTGPSSRRSWRPS